MRLRLEADSRPSSIPILSTTAVMTFGPSVAAPSGKLYWRLSVLCSRQETQRTAAPKRTSSIRTVVDPRKTELSQTEATKAFPPAKLSHTPDAPPSKAPR